MSPLWHLGDVVGDLPRLLLQSLSFPSRRRRGNADPEACARPVAVTGPGSVAGAAGRVVIVGGTSLTDEIVLEMIRLAGGRTARILILPSASLDFTRGGERYARGFRRFGASRVEVLDAVTRQRAEDGSLSERLAEADLIFLGGGRETLFLDILRDSAAHRAILACHRKGGVVAGIGAGAAVLGTMVPVSRERGALTWEAGLGLLPVAVLDRERLQMGQTGRVLYAMAGASEPEAPAVAGLGVDDGTALVVENAFQAYVIGGGMAIIAQRQEEGPSCPGLLVHVLPSGQGYDLGEGRLLPPKQRDPLPQAR